MGGGREVLFGEPAGEGVEVGDKTIVRRGFEQASGGDDPKKLHGVFLRALPGLPVERGEHRAQLRPPGPPKVAREGQEGLEAGGEVGRPSVRFLVLHQLGVIILESWR
jgi:hypothetical protein